MRESSEPYNLLLLYPGPVPPSPVDARNRCYWLSSYARGKVIQRVWWKSRLDAESTYGLGKDQAVKIGGFQFKFLYETSLAKMPLPGVEFIRYLIACLKVASEEKFDAVYAYGANATGLTAVLLKLVFGSKLILDLPGSPQKAFDYDSRKTSRLVALKRSLADNILRLCLRFSDGVKLLYPEQLNYLGKYAPQKSKTFCFHDLAPASSANVEIGDDGYILFLGYPWYLKGVDVLITAFKIIEKEFPQYRLEIWGHDTEEEKIYFKNMARGSDRIIFGHGIDYDTAMGKLSKCSVLVLPSRTEAMGRVILEAFALGKPVIASAVDGIPHYVRDGSTGLLFKSEDPTDLATKLSRLLTDSDLKVTLAKQAKIEFKQQFSEHRFADNFRNLLDRVLRPEVRRT